MRIPWYLVLIFSVSVTVAGCSGAMVELHDAEGTYTFSKALTTVQVREAILEGAKKAGWSARDVGDDKILLTYSIRNHTVIEEIFYTKSYYRFTYAGSRNMKMFCTQQDKKQRRFKVSGQDGCEYGRDPRYIHANYRSWIIALNSAIQGSLASI